MSKYLIQVKTSKNSHDKTLPGITNIIDFSPEGDLSSFGKHFWYNRDFFQLNYSIPTIDLFRFASSIYVIDKIIPRKSSFDNWTRDISLYFPVHDIDLWQKNSQIIIDLLSFLTGDHWEITFIQDHSIIPMMDKKVSKKGFPLNPQVVSLFSGGLDSFIGAIDSIEKNQRIALVGHTDHALVSNAQNNIHEKLVANFEGSEISFVQYFLQPKESQENTTRSRSVLFLSLGTVVAASTNVKTLIVPENGLISLNVPLTYGRIGSLSTKTTHPHTLKLFNDLLIGLGIDVQTINPYQLKTKGEMIRDSTNFELVRDLSLETMSCSHSTAARWEGKPSNKHCGYCLPCLIRRSSLYMNNLDDPKQYSYDIHDSEFLKKKGDKLADLRAVLYALESESSSSSLSKVIGTGPLYPKDKIGKFADLYKRGLAELENFIHKEEIL